ncbi:uncharacterized protein METZ01_LOCUS455217, partial [marine metagenome]
VSIQDSIDRTNVEVLSYSAKSRPFDLATSRALGL